jgi:hypothetical protein
MAEIARRLNQQEVETRRGKLWTVWSIGRILHNPVYAGFLRWEGFLIPNDHAPLISIETFNEVQARIASHVKDPKHRHLSGLPVAGAAKDLATA